MPYKRAFVWVSLVTAFVAYLWGLYGVQILKIGDEVLYLQIARVTSESGSWLPLRYEGGVFNTKPPLLYWLGIFFTKIFGTELWLYRLPVVIFTFLGAGIVYSIGKCFLKSKVSSLWAATCFLGFVAIFQHGRPFLVNSFEIVFLLLPLLYLYKNPKLNFSNWIIFTLCWGAVSWAKSFALIVVGVGALFSASFYLLEQKLFKRIFYFASSALVSLAIFSMWFVFDPDPKLLFQQFIIGENAVKFKGYAHYFSGLFYGNYTLFRIWLAPLANAGLYLLLVAALFYLLFKNRTKLPQEDRALLAFVAFFFIFYSLPTQRQENYLLPVMGVLALFLAKYREAFHPRIWKSSLFLTDIVFLFLSLAPLVLSLWSDLGWLAKTLLLISIVIYPLIYFVWDSKLAFPVLVLLCFIQLSNFSDPFNKTFQYLDRRDDASLTKLWAPSRKLAQHERFRFIAPGTHPFPYEPESTRSVCETLNQGDFILVESDSLSECQRLYKIREEVLDFKTRQKIPEILKILSGQKEYLLRKLHLIEIL